MDYTKAERRFNIWADLDLRQNRYDFLQEPQPISVKPYNLCFIIYAFLCLFYGLILKTFDKYLSYTIKHLHCNNRGST